MYRRWDKKFKSRQEIGEFDENFSCKALQN